MGRKRINVDGIVMMRGDEEVGRGYDLLKKLAGLGLTQQQIADMLCFSERTLRNRLNDDERTAEAYEAGRAQVAYEIASRHRRIALHGTERESRLACEFWLERQFGWSKPKPAEDRSDVEIPVSVMAVPMPMTITEWQAAAIANSEALDALAEREVHRLEAPRAVEGGDGG